MEQTDPKDKLIELMDSYGNLVFSVCLKMTGDYFTAEDIAQDTFISAYEHLKDFDDVSAKAWLCRIASNKCIDHLKAAKRREVPSSDSEELQMESTRDGPLEIFATKDVIHRVKARCNELPKGYSEIATMYFIESLSAKEISANTGIPLKTVQTKIYRAREMLRKTVRKEDLLT